MYICNAGSELDSASYGLNPSETVSTKDDGEVTISRLTEILEDQYCGTTGLECGYLEDVQEMDWLCNKYQEVKNSPIEVLVHLYG